MSRGSGRTNDEMWKLARRMNQLMDEWMHAKFRGDPVETWEPAVDIIESEQHVCVLVELAGMKRDDIDVTIEGDAITLSGARMLNQVANQTGVRQMELARGPFRRTVHLGFAVPVDGVEMLYEAGLLEIRMPRP